MDCSALAPWMALQAQQQSPIWQPDHLGRIGPFGTRGMCQSLLRAGLLHSHTTFFLVRWSPIQLGQVRIFGSDECIIAWNSSVEESAHSLCMYWAQGFVWKYFQPDLRHFALELAKLGNRRTPPEEAWQFGLVASRQDKEKVSWSAPWSQSCFELGQSRLEGFQRNFFLSRLARQWRNLLVVQSYFAGHEKQRHHKWPTFGPLVFLAQAKAWLGQASEQPLGSSYPSCAPISTWLATQYGPRSDSRFPWKFLAVDLAA